MLQQSISLHRAVREQYADPSCLSLPCITFLQLTAQQCHSKQAQHDACCQVFQLLTTSLPWQINNPHKLNQLHKVPLLQC